MNKKISRLCTLLAASHFFTLAFIGFMTYPNSHDQLPDLPQQESVQIETINFPELGFSEPITLIGPYQAASTDFSLPPDWKITGEVQVELKTQATFQSLLEVFVTDDTGFQPANQVGRLMVSINDHVVADFAITESGEELLVFSFPASLLKEDLEKNQLVIAWDSNTACKYDITTYIAIEPSSSISIPHESKTSQINLVNFPKPFYESTLMKTYPTAVILPNNPVESELSALMAVSAGLGKQTDGNMDYEVFQMEEASRRDLGGYHVVVTGLQSNIEKFLGNNAMDLKNALSQSGKGKQNGILWYQPSPWNNGRTLLIVTGEDGESLLKASAVVASSDLVPFSNENLALIADISSAARVEQLKIDYPLSELSTSPSNLRVENIGVTQIIIPFHIPGEVTITPESYLELYFRHSQRLNYLRSGLTISINGKSIGTIRFSDNSAENGLARIILPPNAVHPWKNELEFTYTINAQDLCADERGGDYWISIIEESYLHLPPDFSLEGSRKENYFNHIPWVFLHDSRMSDITFVTAGESFQDWRYAAEIAYTFGSFIDANVLMPSALNLEAMMESPISKNIILVGKTNEIAPAEGMLRLLSVPFGEVSSINALTIDGIRFDVDQTKDFGFLEISFDNESGNHILSVLGNTEKGQQNALISLHGITFADDKPAANVRVIDSKNNIFDFTIEQESTATGPGPAREAGWLERLTQLDASNTAFLLLGITGLITALFIGWSFFLSGKKRTTGK